MPNTYWATNDSELLAGGWWIFGPPGLCLALVGFALVMLNAAFDEVANPRLRQDRAWRAWLFG